MIQNDKSFCINLIDFGTLQLLFGNKSFLASWIDSDFSIRINPYNI